METFISIQFKKALWSDYVAVNGFIGTRNLIQAGQSPTKPRSFLKPHTLTICESCVKP